MLTHPLISQFPTHTVSACMCKSWSSSPATHQLRPLCTQGNTLVPHGPGQHEPQQQPRLFINSIAKGIPLYPELLSPPSSFPIPPPPFCPKTVETWRLTGTLNHSRKPQSSWQFTKAEQSSYWGKEGCIPQPSGSGAMLAQLNRNMA